jgi:predicted transcriptional regulator
MLVENIMVTKIMKVGVISREDYIKRTIAIAKGNYKPRKDEPKIWFESLQSMSQVLSSENQELLKVIIDNKPKSLSELEKLSHRKKSNLSRTLKTLERYGIVELLKEEGRLVPKVKATDFEVEFGLHYSKPFQTDLENAAV